MDNTKPKYILVEEKIRQAIKNREIVDKLPGERTLEKEFGFSYMTIRKAISNLVAEGILYKIQTTSEFVRERKTPKNKTHQRKKLQWLRYKS